MTELCLSCRRVMSCRSVSSYVQALQNPCVWTTARSFSFLVLCLLRNNWTPAMTGWTNLICLHLWDGSPNLSCWQKDLKPSKESHVTWYRSICRNSQWYSRYFPKTQRGARNCSEQLVVCSEPAGDFWRSRIGSTQEGKVEASQRGAFYWSRWALLEGGGHLHGCAVTPGGNPMGRGPQLEPDVHKGTASSVPRQLLQGGLWAGGLCRAALQGGHAASMGPLGCPPALCQGCALLVVGRGGYLSNLWGQFFGCSPVLMLQSHQKMGLEDRTFAKHCSRAAC